jgi:hypothetical protein
VDRKETCSDGSCPMAGFGIGGVEPLGSVATGFFLFFYVVRLSPLGTSATVSPILPAPDDR